MPLEHDPDWEEFEKRIERGIVLKAFDSLEEMIEIMGEKGEAEAEED